MFNPFEVFGVSKKAPCQEIRLRYTHLLKTHHPDTSVQHKGLQGHSIQHIVDAYNVLKNKKLRHIFLRTLDLGITFQNPHEFLDFAARYNADTPEPVKETPTAHNFSITLSLEESLLGTQKRILFNTSPIFITIAPNIHDQEVIHYQHQLAIDQQVSIAVTVFVVPHPFLRREGHDLICTCPISFAEALEGGEVSIPTPYEVVRTKLPPFEQGQRICVPHKGVRFGDQQGDLTILPVITPPPTTSSCSQRVIAAEQAYPYNPRTRFAKYTKESSQDS